MESLFKIFDGHWVTLSLWMTAGVLIVFIGWLGLQKPSQRPSWKYRIALFAFAVVLLIFVLFVQFCQCAFMQVSVGAP